MSFLKVCHIYHIDFTCYFLFHYYSIVSCLMQQLFIILSGVLNKSRGQVFRLTVVMHMLLHIDDPDQQLPVVIDECAIKASVNFVQLACQQTLFIAGKGKLDEEMEKFRAGNVY